MDWLGCRKFRATTTLIHQFQLALSGISRPARTTRWVGGRGRKPLLVSQTSPTNGEPGPGEGDGSEAEAESPSPSRSVRLARPTAESASPALARATDWRWRLEPPPSWPSSHCLWSRPD